MARSDFEPMLGLLPGDICGFVGVVSCPTLLCGTVIVSPRQSPGVLFRELGAFIKRLGCTGQRRCQVFGGLPVTTCCALKEALPLGVRAPVRGLPSTTSRFLATLPLLDPTAALALRPLLVSGFLTLVNQALALIRNVLPVVGGSVALIRDPVTLIRDPVTVIRGLLASVRHPLALVGHPLGHHRLSPLTGPPTLTTQPVTLALQARILGHELPLPASNLRAETLDIWPRRFIGRFEQAGA